MNKPKETPIFPMSVEPIREGVYKLHLTEICGAPFIKASLWKNGQWRAFQPFDQKAFAATIKSQSVLAYNRRYVKGWSGLAEPPHDK